MCEGDKREREKVCVPGKEGTMKREHTHTDIWQVVCTKVEDRGELVPRSWMEMKVRRDP